MSIKTRITPDQHLAGFLNRRYPGGPFELNEVLETKGQRKACRVRGSVGEYVVKISEPGRAESLVRSDVGALAALAQRGFPAPRPVLSSDGQLYLPYKTGQFIYLYEYVQGTTPRPGLDFYRRMGLLLARLHSLPVDSSLPRSSYRPAAILSEARSLLASVTAADQRAVLPEVLEMIDRFPSFEDLPEGMIHSDPYFVNLLEDGQGKLFMIDWDDGGVAYPLMDVGYVLAHLCTFTARDRRLLGIEDGESGPSDGVISDAVISDAVISDAVISDAVISDAVSCRPDWGREFLTAYETLRPLTGAERARLPDAIRLSFIAYLYDWGSGNLILDNYRRMKLIEGFYG